MASMFERPSAASLQSALFDLIVVGGGITGAGVAQDAASRGLKVLLLEKGDFASGTSSKSTKLIHGGLRYLQNGQVGVVRESLRERQLMMQLAPHMVWSVPFVIPRFRGQKLKNAKLSLGLWVYDLLAGISHQGSFHKRISAEEVRRLCPGITGDGLIGGFLYEDCRTDDARHTLAVLKSASQHGAVCVNYARVVGLVHDGCPVNGVVVRLADAEGNWSAPFEVRSRAVVDATGVWTQEFATGVGASSRVRVVPAKGIHITVSRKTLPLKSAMIIPSVHDKRFCFAVPWYDGIVIGTTDSEYNGSLDHVVAEPEEIAYVLDAVNALFPGRKLTASDITGSFAGLRPLIMDPAKQNTADLARTHSLTVAPDGLITIAGGKLTTYRPMAKSVVDKVMLQLPDRRRFARCRTDKLMLGGFSSASEVEAVRALAGDLCGLLETGQDTADYLVSAYGSEALQVLALAASDEELAQPLVPGHPYILAQVLYAARCEAARTVDDVLSRRIRLSITDSAAARAAAPRVAAILGQELGWSDQTLAEQLAEFLKAGS